MTEDEAKKKWCPMARLQNGVGSYNRLSPQGFGCVASACMMWRWDTERETEYRKKGEPFPDGEGWVQETTYDDGARSFVRPGKDGRCGMAGARGRA